MVTGVKPKDTLTSQPLNPLALKSNKVVSPTVGGAGNSVRRPTGELDPFADQRAKPRVGKSSTQILFP